jgi:hypothetical protein
MTPTISNSKTKTPHMSEINQKGGFVSDFDDTSFKSISLKAGVQRQIGTGVVIVET